MFKRTILILIFTVVFAMLFISCDEVNSPREDLFQSEQLNSIYVIESDLSLLKEGGMDIDGADGIFSIGWNEIFRPFDTGTEVMGTAFAVAFGEDPGAFPHFHRFGIDMGSVFINYTSNQVEMRKHSDDRRGTAYTLFKKPFGQSNDVLDFIPNEEYEFEVTGSALFTTASFILTSPAALIDITSHNHADEIDPTQDLTIEWEGGNADGKVAVRLMPGFRLFRDGMGRHRDGRGPHHFPFDRIIFVVLDSNTGTYTFSAEEIQQVLEDMDTEGIIVGVSQMDFQEVEHDGKILYTVMRNGNSVILSVQ